VEGKKINIQRLLPFTIILFSLGKGKGKAMEAFSRVIEETRVFSITTEPTLYESLYLVSRFRNWPTVYNLCFPSKLTDVQENVVAKTAVCADVSPHTWIRSFCRIANEAIDKLAADILKVKLSGMSKADILHAKKNNNPCVCVSITELTENISSGFSNFCKQLASAARGNFGNRETGKDSVKEEEVLTIDNITDIDKSRDKEQQDQFAQKNLDRLIYRLGITPTAFWFMIYVITQIDPEEEQDNLMRCLYTLARSDVIFNEETFAELERWKSSDVCLEARGTLNPDSMTFLFMFHRP